MQITTPALSDVLDSQTMASRQETSPRTAKGAGITVSTVQPTCFNEPAQRSEHKPFSEYRVGQLAHSVLQAGTGLLRRTTDFAFRQVMNSRDIGSVAPGLKENVLVMMAIYHNLQATEAASATTTPATTTPATTTPATTTPATTTPTPPLATTSATSTATTPAWFSLSTEENSPPVDADSTEENSPPVDADSTEENSPLDAESSSLGGIIAPVVIVGGILAAGTILYGGCVYKSYHALRRNDQESSNCQLIGKALRHPLYFRQTHYPIAMVVLDPSNVAPNKKENMKTESTREAQSSAV